MATTKHDTPEGLPTEITYEQVEQALRVLAPDLPIHLVGGIVIRPTRVTLTYWDGRAETTRAYPITHPHGSATEGGQPE